MNPLPPFRAIACERGSRSASYRESASASAAGSVMSAVTGFPIHRGVLAIGLRGEEPDASPLVPPSPRSALVLGLAGLTNHDNVGGLFRNAAAFGADAVLLDAESCDPLYRKAIRVSAGAAHAVQSSLYEGERTRFHRRVKGIAEGCVQAGEWQGWSIRAVSSSSRCSAVIDTPAMSSEV